MSNHWMMMTENETIEFYRIWTLLCKHMTHLTFVGKMDIKLYLQHATNSRHPIFALASFLSYVGMWTFVLIFPKTDNAMMVGMASFNSNAGIIHHITHQLPCQFPIPLLSAWIKLEWVITFTLSMLIIILGLEWTLKKPKLIILGKITIPYSVSLIDSTWGSFQWKNVISYSNECKPMKAES